MHELRAFNPAIAILSKTPEASDLADFGAGDCGGSGFSCSGVINGADPFPVNIPHRTLGGNFLDLADQPADNSRAFVSVIEYRADLPDE